MSLMWTSGLHHCAHSFEHIMWTAGLHYCAHSQALTNVKNQTKNFHLEGAAQA